MSANDPKQLLEFAVDPEAESVDQDRAVARFLLQLVRLETVDCSSDIESPSKLEA